MTLRNRLAMWRFRVAAERWLRQFPERERRERLAAIVGAAERRSAR